MGDSKSRRLLQRSSASAMGRDLSIEAGLAGRNLRPSESRVIMRRRLASMRVGNQRRRRYQRIATGPSVSS
jgi:hypothetical protein